MVRITPSTNISAKQRITEGLQQDESLRRSQLANVASRQNIEGVQRQRGIEDAYSGAFTETAEQTGSATPFDTPEYKTNLMNRLATTPGGGRELIKIKQQRDKTISDVLEMIGNGEVDEAKLVSEREQLNIPEQFYRNGNLALGMSYANKAYPNEPDKGMLFFQHFMSQGDAPLIDRVNAGISAAGTPTTAAQRQLENSMKLAKWKQDQGIGQRGQTGTRYIKVGSNLVDTQDLDERGRPRVVSGGRDKEEMARKFFAEIFDPRAYLNDEERRNAESAAWQRARIMAGITDQQGATVQQAQPQMQQQPQRRRYNPATGKFE